MPPRSAPSLPNKPSPNAFDQAGAVHAALVAAGAGASAKEVARSFGRATDGRVERVAKILETIEALGKARELDDGRYVAV